MALLSPQERRSSDAEHLQSARVELRVRLEARRAEIEREALTRANAISDSAKVSDPAYAQGLRSTVSAALDYALEVIERGGEDPVPLPGQLLAQARNAARRGVPLDTVLRRYVAGYTLLGDFLARETEVGGFGVALARLLPNRAAVLDRLIAAVSAEYERELNRRAASSSARRSAERVQRLLAGEPVDGAELHYDFDRFHLGLVAQGGGCEQSLRDLAHRLDCTVLLVTPDVEVGWAWIGTRYPIDPRELDLGRDAGDPPLAIALGEPADGLAGWRLTHRQATAAMKVAQRSPGSGVRYRDVAILATALKDDVLAASLHRLYIAPLQKQRDGGQAAMETLRAYLTADRNATSAAAALGVNRNTVTERIRAIEAAIDRSLPACGPELEAALCLAELDVTDVG
jgi:hypothetical protein